MKLKSNVLLALLMGFMTSVVAKTSGPPAKALWVKASQPIVQVSLSAKYQWYHKHLMIIASTVAMLDVLLIRFLSPSITVEIILFFILGVCAGSTSTATTLAKESMPLSISGLTMSFVNTLLVLVGAFSQPLFGYLLGMGEKSMIDLNSISVASFHRAFLLMPSLYLVGLLCAFLVRNVKQQAA